MATLEQAGLTVDDLSQLLKQPVKEVKFEKTCAKGDNVMGQLESLLIELQNGEIHFLVLKTLPISFRERAIFAQVFWIEVSFYKGVYPLLAALAPERPLPIAKFYSGNNNNQTDYILLEDLKIQGFKMGNKYTGLSLQEAELALTEIGKFHARGYALIQNEGFGIFDRNPNGVDISLCKESPWKKMGPEVIAGMFTPFFETMKEVVRKRKPELAQRLDTIDITPKSVVKLMNHNQRYNDKLFQTTIHGDYWTNNIMFKYDEDGKSPIDIRFVDFQMMRKGNVIEELIYFTSTSTTAELRKNHFEVLMAKYYRAFLNELKELGVNPPPNYSLGRLIDCLYEAKLAIFFYLSFAIPVQLGIKEDDKGREEKADADWLRDIAEGSEIVMKRYEEALEELVYLGIL